MHSLTTNIVEACKRNDRKAQMQLYNKYCNGMFAVAMRFLQNTAEAEDAVQEAFIKAFSKLHQFQGEVTFGAWLKRIVINRSLDMIKAKKERLVPLEATHLKVVDSNTEDRWMVDDSISVEDIKATVNQLPDKYKYVVMLYLFEGYDHEEISEILNITQVASRTQLSRGKAKLLKLLEQKHNGTGY